MLEDVAGSMTPNSTSTVLDLCCAGRSELATAIAAAIRPADGALPLQHGDTVSAGVLASALLDEGGGAAASRSRWRRRLRGLGRVIAGHVRSGRAATRDVLAGLRLAELEVQRHLWSDACANNLNGAARRSELVADRCGQLRSEVVMLLVRDAEEDNARSSGELLTETLLVDSDTARAVAGDLGIRLADRWMVAAVLDPEAAGQLGRKDELVSFHKGICCVLVAITGDDDGGSALRVAEATCAAVVGLAGPAGTEELQSALRRATDIVSLGHAAGLTGVVTEFDVLVEESAATDAEVSARLSAIVARLDEAGARLVETLISFYANDMSRTRTACALGVHRSTLEYRFKRIRQLTGFCPASTRGVVLFSTALTVAQVL